MRVADHRMHHEIYKQILKRKEVKHMKTFETPKVVELGTLTQIVLSQANSGDFKDSSTVPHTSSGQMGS